jgi:hypothetical protein
LLPRREHPRTLLKLDRRELMRNMGHFQALISHDAGDRRLPDAGGHICWLAFQEAFFFR